MTKRKENINSRIEELKEEFKNEMIEMGISNTSMETIINNIFYDGNIKPDIKPDTDMLGLFK